MSFGRKRTAVAEPIVVDGFFVDRPIKAKAATATKAKAKLTTTGAHDFVLHVTNGVPTIGYHSGEYWVMRVTNGGVPTITSK